MRSHTALFLLALIALSGCISSDDGPDPFALCGNMEIDGDEECDDGNLNDIDDCLATCVLNRCGDEFLNLQGPENPEVCDGRNLNNRNCASLGFLGGALACSSDCQSFDTSACTPRPTPPPTPTATARPG